MTMSRDAALDYLQNEFSQQLADTGMPSTDTADGFESAINSALRQLGFTRSEFDTAEVEDDGEEAFEVFLEYFALKRFSKYVAQNFDITDDGTSARLQQLFANIKSLLDLATKAAQTYGLASDSEFGNEYGSLDLRLGIYAC